jgi:hypothetical protein
MYSSALLDLSNWWQGETSFTPQSLYHHGKSPFIHRIGGWVCVVGWGTMLHVGRSKVPFPYNFIKCFDWPKQKRVPRIFLGVMCGRRIMLTNSPPSVSRRQGWHSQSYLCPDCLENVGNSTSRNRMGLHSSLSIALLSFKTQDAHEICK